jgi:hypothetical protein
MRCGMLGSCKTHRPRDPNFPVARYGGSPADRGIARRLRPAAMPDRTATRA